MKNTAILLAATALPLVCLGASVSRAAENEVQIAGADIAGKVTSPAGAEAGVWVIAETKDLPTRYIKIVVTDDNGRYLLPNLPKAKYQIWVRGYGLVDSKPQDVEPGRRIDLLATPAPDAKAAAQYYPAAYWYALLKPPAESEFPGTGASGNGIAPIMLTRQYWLQNMKEQCINCHQFGDKATRELAVSGNSVEAWGDRLKMARADGDPTINNSGKDFSQTMQNNIARFGRTRGLKMYADWTDRIAAGELPNAIPPRPQGIERNVVLTIQDWGAGHYIHDQTSTDLRDPHVNAGGPFYGSAYSQGTVEVLDPKTMKVRSIPIPGIDPASPHDEGAAVNYDLMDGKRRTWLPADYTEGPEPAWCTDGSVPSSKYYPLTTHKKAAGLPVYDPATDKVEALPLCAGGNHGAFTFDKDSTLYLSGDTEVLPWINTRVWDETHDLKKATGWCPLVLDTSGDGKIDPDRSHWIKPPDLYGGLNGGSGEHAFSSDVRAAEKPVLARGKDTQISHYLYGITVAKDETVWAAAYSPYVPSGIVHLIPGNNPPETCKTEYFEPPKLPDGKYAAVGIRGVGVDSDGVAWAAFSSGQVGAFDRRKCRILNGPTATGQHCPEGWHFYDLPSPKVGDTEATSDFVYTEYPDYFNVFGLGENTHFFPAVNSDSILALPKGASKFLVFRVPYPMGFYTRSMDFRIDDANEGWKGRSLRTTYSSVPVWHQEGGEGENSKIVTFQLRPNPLAD